MIASWMLYAAVIGGLVTLAAFAAERVASERGVPVRFVWSAAILLSMALPAGSAVRRLLPQRTAPVVVLPFAITLPATTIAPDGAVNRARLIDRGLVSLWAGLSILFIFRIGQAIVSLRRSRSSWQLGDVDGTRVRLSDNVGPAVVGLRSMDVVLPEWIMTLDAPLRAIVLRHEEEHRTARDPYLLFAAGVAVALMPWNVALWLQARRLRLAIEMDCDRRVLRAHPSPERYGMLMLTIAQRRSIAPAMFAPMLSEPATQLERRILAMRQTTHRLARLTVYGGTALAAGALLFACALQSDTPTAPTPHGAASATRAAGPTKMNANQTYFEFQVEKAVSVLPGNPGPRYPDLLRSAGISGEVLAQFIVDTLGHADMSTFKVLKSTHDLFTAATLGALPTMQFSPAQVGGRPVKQLVQMPFQFSLSKTDAAKAAAAKPASDARLATGRPAQATNEVLKLPAVEATPSSGARGASPEAAAAAPKPAQGYVEFQIEKHATVKAGVPSPRYPDMLRSANIEGEVLAQFVVDPSGHPITSSLKIIRSSHDLFSEAVRANLPNVTFDPATVGGRAVHELITMPFTFSLSK